jgi:hypothetical protein
MGKREVVEERSSRLILSTPPHLSGLTEETHAKFSIVCVFVDILSYFVLVYIQKTTAIGI